MNRLLYFFTNIEPPYFSWNTNLQIPKLNNGIENKCYEIEIEIH